MLLLEKGNDVKIENPKKRYANIQSSQSTPSLSLSLFFWYSLVILSAIATSTTPFHETSYVTEGEFKRERVERIISFAN